jgi:hypothetical protein
MDVVIIYMAAVDLCTVSVPYGPFCVDRRGLNHGHHRRTTRRALDGVVISSAERASLTWLAGFEKATVGHIAQVITRAQQTR